MSDTNNEGASNFLDRLEGQLNEASGADSLEEQRLAGEADNKTGDEESKKPEGTEDLDGLRDTSGDRGSKPDPLDDLAEEANKTAADPKDAPAGEEDKGEEKAGDHTDVLSEFDAEDQAKLQKYLDERLAEELKLTETAGGAFKRLKGENRELENKVRELESRTAEPEALTAATDRIAELEAQVRANEEANSVLRLEDTEAYKTAVTKPQQDILAASDAIADRYGADRDALANALGNPNRRELADQLGKLLGEDLAEADKFELYDLNRRAEATFTKKAELNSNAEAALKEAEELTSKAKERQALETRQSREAAAKDTVSRLQAKAKFVLDLVGQDAVDTFVTNNAEKPVDALSPADQAFARFAFDAFIPMAKKYRQLEEELQTANDDILKLRGANPGGDGSGGGTPTDKEGTKKSDAPSTGIVSAVDRIGSALAGAL